ncbi:MAG: HlyD family efflux transporter periplasmic adaptor subunit [Clostridiales bacterium]|nr:HlyD family efflux transporter periplasmic adaptor subunit [Clostridiales bacterium]
MKNNLKILLILTISAGLCACSSSEEETTETAKIVKTQAVSEESTSAGYSYLGIVKAKETKNYSFLSSGKIKEICVEKGGEFKSGDVLARLDTTTMEYNASIGKNTQAQAEAVLQKTISTYDTNISNAKSQIETIEKSIAAGEKGIEALELALKAEQQNIDAGQTSLDTLYSNLNAARELNKVGGYSDLDLDALESQYKSSTAELEAAKAAHEGNKATLESQKAELEALKAQKTEAETTLENLCTSKSKDVAAAQADVASASLSNDILAKNINDAVITADSDGYVMELPYEEGEVVSAGYPVVVAKSKELVVTVGASDSEYKDIVLGGTVLINGEAVGTVDTIAQYPDESTRTYAVDILINTDYSSYTIGETVDVKIITGDTTGCYVPIDAVFNSDGVDYVYAVSPENRVYKKQVVLGGFMGDKVEVQIDDPAAVVVTEGVKSLRENDLVTTED